MFNTKLRVKGKIAKKKKAIYKDIRSVTTTYQPDTERFPLNSAISLDSHKLINGKPTTRTPFRVKKNETTIS